jgi:hypothetical protein
VVSLKHYGNGKIHINGNEYEFSDFLKLEPDYCSPWRFPVRVYEKGVQHTASDGYNTIRLSLHDPECDRICDREGELVRLIQRLAAESEEQ